MRALLQDKWAVAALIVIGLFIFLAAFANLICMINGADPYTYNIDALNDIGQPNVGPSFDHWFGVEPTTGRDLFAITVFGARTSLLVGLFATILSVSIGTIYGMISGYFGGICDAILSRFNDLMLNFPALIFMIALRGIVPDEFPRELLMVLIIGLFGWSGIARIIRSETVRIKNQDFITASLAGGSNSLSIVFKHIFPNLIKTVVIFGTMSIPAMISSEAALSFLGVGLAPPTPSWGRNISDAINWVYTDPAYLLIPGIALLLITLAFNQFGDTLRNVYDPTQKKSGGV